MNSITAYFRELYDTALRGWNRFWFTPADPATYCLIRVLGGLMIFYTHLAWTLELENFFGPGAWLSREAVNAGPEVGSLAWSYLWLIDSTAVLWTVHLAALLALAMLALGLFSRVTSVLAFLIVVSYAHRAPAALFGLDQINGLLAMYLMIGPSGARYSLDALIARRRARRSGQEPAEPAPSTSANIGIRLMQVHMCVVYFFAAVGKLQGVTWWDGSAMWYSVANLEYQSIDMTWLAGWPLLISFMTHLTVAWELFYCVLIWPRLTRPIVLFLAVPLHLGIALFLGMITFGLVMLIANLAFVSPRLVRALLEPKRSTEPVPA